jgi:hypothetical protein
VGATVGATEGAVGLVTDVESGLPQPLSTAASRRSVRAERPSACFIVSGCDAVSLHLRRRADAEAPFNERAKPRIEAAADPCLSLAESTSACPSLALTQTIGGRMPDSAAPRFPASCFR